MKKKIFNNFYLVLLLFFILPYNYSKLVFQNDNIVMTIIIYIVRFILLFYVVYYLKNIKLRDEEKPVFKWVSIYFVFIFLLNIISTLSSDQFSSSNLITRMFSMIYMYGFYVYMIYNHHHFDLFNSKMKIVCSCLLIFSLLLYCLFPDIGQSYEGYNSYVFVGVGGNRNSYFELMFPAIVATFFTKNKKLNILDILLVGSIIVTTIATRSITSLFAIIVFFSIIIIGKLVKNKKRFLKICYLSVYLIWIVFFAFLLSGRSIGNFSASFDNKSTTLSGRTIIWEKSMFFINQNPVLGYGYDNTIIGDTTNYLTQSNNVFPNDTHNSVLFMLLSSGIVGTIPLIYILTRTLKKSLTVVEADERYLFIVAFIIAILIRGLTESCFHYPHLAFTLYLIMINIRYNELLDNKKKERLML